VVGFGGYASLPCVLAARLLRVPVVVHEQDAAPGLANRWGVRLGARPAVSLPDTPLPNATLTGNPVRAAFAHLDRPAAVAGDPALVAVFGGAQGARTINRAALGCYDSWRARTDLAVHHVCGPRNLDTCSAELAAQRRPEDALQYELVGYEERMDLVYQRAALAVCRSGAGTIAELTAVGLPAVLVPLPGAPSDHQTRNAQSLERAGAAVLLPDAECDPARLDKVVSELLGAADRLDQMGVAARGLGRRDAAERLADLVEEHARAA
jgi:UDP-N-acetylglucosamine--N-acetylmuramyl-(pentapeptide) pyrophosphoryl-undecaprenol N-acetylglucosamine transferase